ncbi:MAG: hypothetical protein KDA71_10305, partial [Planctomycetales bacterium]|nr:hypothetical protein [Planctomycetales bacterium]
AAARGSVAGSRTARLMEKSHWLCPLEDLRAKGSVREGVLPDLSLGSYLLLLDYSRGPFSWQHQFQSDRRSPKVQDCKRENRKYPQ